MKKLARKFPYWFSIYRKICKFSMNFSSKLDSIFIEASIVFLDIC